MDKVLQSIEMDFTGLSFVNLVDFDALFGHRRDPIGYGKALEEFDQRLSEVLTKINEDDLLIITADHGNDPVILEQTIRVNMFHLLVYSKSMNTGGELPISETFADIGATIAENFAVKMPLIWKKFFKSIKK